MAGPFVGADARALLSLSSVWTLRPTVSRAVLSIRSQCSRIGATLRRHDHRRCPRPPGTGPGPSSPRRSRRSPAATSPSRARPPSRSGPSPARWAWSRRPCTATSRAATTSSPRSSSTRTTRSASAAEQRARRARRAGVVARWVGGEQGDPHVGARATRTSTRSSTAARCPGYAAPAGHDRSRGRVSRSRCCRSSSTASRSGEIVDAETHVECRARCAATSRSCARPAAPGVPDAVLSRALLAWAQLFGSISLEMFGHLHNVIHDYDAFFELQMRHCAEFLVGRARAKRQLTPPAAGEPARLVNGRPPGSNRPWPRSGCSRGSSCGADGAAPSRSRSLVGAIGAIVLATAAGARRSDTALARFNTYSRSADVEISIGTTPLPPSSKRSAERRASRAIARMRGYALVDGRQREPRARGAGRLRDGQRRGSRPRHQGPAGRSDRAPNELTIGEALAQQLHLHVGS